MTVTKSIDFRANSGDLKVYGDAKTIKPVATDRWEQFERAQAEAWLPNNVNVMLQREWLGGELWHNMFAARSRMLEYSLELEQKIAEGNLLEGNTLFVLALCGEGFYWHQDELEDFVSYYYSGVHRGDDPFSKAEVRHIQERHISIARTISRFACMRRPQGNILQQRLNWNVLPPRHQRFALRRPVTSNVMGLYEMPTKWLHIETGVGDPWILPIWGAVNDAENSKRIPRLPQEIRELGLHISTRLDILPYVISRINFEVSQVYETTKQHTEEQVFTESIEGYVLQMKRDLVHFLLADIDSLLFELHSLYKLMTNLFERLHSHVGSPVKKGQAGPRIKQILDSNGMNSQWFQDLDSHRNFFTHKGAPFFAVDTSKEPNRYDLLIMKENNKTFTDPEKFIRLSQLDTIVRGFATAKPVLQEYLINLFRGIDP